MHHTAVTRIPADLATLFETLGPRTDTVDWVAFDDEDGAWTVVFDDGTAVLLEWDEPLERLVVQSLLGRPADHARDAVHQAVLAYNAMWRRNAGARIGMVDTDGELALFLDVPVRALSLEQLQRVLAAVQSVATAWARCVADPGDSPTNEAGTCEASLDGRLQRV